MASVKNFYNSVRCSRLNNSGKSYSVVSEGNAGMVLIWGNAMLDLGIVSPTSSKSATDDRPSRLRRQHLISRYLHDYGSTSYPGPLARSGKAYMPLEKRVYKRCGPYARKGDHAEEHFEIGEEDEKNAKKFDTHAKNDILPRPKDRMKYWRSCGWILQGAEAPFRYLKRACQVSIISIVNNVKESTKKMRVSMF